MESLMSLNMTAFQARLLRRRQLKVHLNHRKLDQAKQTERLEPKGNGNSHGARTVKFWPFTHQHPRWIAPAYRSTKRIMGTE